MTNGEKIKATFPHYDIEIDEHKGYVRVFYEDFYTTYPLKWWNAEYKEPTTKNNLGVDCVDRQAAIAFVCKNTEEILKDTMPLEVKLSDDYLYENVAKIMRNPKVLSSVTPIRPKGHWIGSRRVGCGFGEFKEYIVPLKDGFVTDSCHCSECGEWLTGSDEYQCSGNFCPNCGADMREVEE